MKTIARLVLSLLGFLLASVASLPAAEAAASGRKKVLFFTKSSGFEHDAIKLAMRDGRPGFAFPVMQALADKNNFEVVFSKDGSLFTPAYLAQFDAFVFYTTGDLTVSKPNEPGMTEEGKAAFFKAIEGGKGFVGVHSASDTFHSPGNERDGTLARHTNDGENASAYIKLLGGEFVSHGAQQPGRQMVADAKFPGMAAVPADFGPNEEWYSLKNFPSDLHVLLVQETKDMRGNPYQRPPYPSTWARTQGKGRVFYTSMGHREDVWTSPVFQTVLANGIDWALGRVNADIAPNLSKAAPQANVLPMFTPPQPRPAQASPAAPAPAPKAP
jgi:type 1 glutamine amidotransferase